MRLIVNTLSAVRIIGAVGLVFLQPLSPLFFVIYALCGISDVLDGWLARKAGVTSDFGAALDSFADMIFIAAILVALWPVMNISFGLQCWIVGIAAIKVLSLVVGYVRFHTYAALHTYASKAAGLSLFVLPVFFVFAGPFLVTFVICVIATFAALEELFLTAVRKTLDRNTKGCLSPER
ncbi:MAG: CDP-alcohol phosphatidyltransferase family protein [Gordonibacter sp.]|uniref:CDP-alcohol phosphatidyltransferase family protein n=1 Tax=Gordonibacter sp. TaxID=1968902 RepID=UPI002FC5F89A